jgi:hypothetical protein
MPGNRRVQALAVSHLVLGVGTAVLAPIKLSTPFGLDHILTVPIVASALCQAFLIALWGAASQTTAWKRLAGLVTAAVYLEGLVGPGFIRREFLGTSTITITVATGSLLVVQRLGVRFTRQTEVGQLARPEPEGLRFSIRDLMILTAAVALLCVGAKALQQSPNRLLLLVLFLALCFVAVGLVSLWAALGDARPLRRSPVAFVLSPVLGAFFAFAARAHSAGWVYVLLIMLLYPAALLGSLLIVRSCGYRLVRSPVPSAGRPDDEGRCEMANGGSAHREAG